MTAPSHITLLELQRRIKSAVEGSLPLPLWVVAEISDMKVNQSGHCYMELVEKSSESHNTSTQPVAQARAVIWRGQWSMLSAYFRKATGSPLSAGMKILAKVIVSYHELYGLSLQITDLDASYTLGEAERQKQLTIEQLKADGVWDMNREAEMPLLVQRIAVVSSSTAAGYRDFCNQLSEGGYAFRIELFEAIMQGAAAEDSICEQLEAIATRAEEFDAVVVIRGGGSVSDLSCFNSYRLCSYVAQFPLPILTGIGHDKDVSVADMVAHTPLKTPTAVAGWLIERMKSIDERLGEYAYRLTDFVGVFLAQSRLKLVEQREKLHRLTQNILSNRGAALNIKREQLQSLTKLQLERERLKLASFRELILSQQSGRILGLGFAIVRRDGCALKSAKQMTQGDKVHIQMQDGEVVARIEEGITENEKYENK